MRVLEELSSKFFLHAMWDALRRKMSKQNLHRVKAMQSLQVLRRHATISMKPKNVLRINI